MKNYPVHITATITEKNLQKGTYIFIYRASKIPPHIGIITNSLLYDITSVGPNIDLSVVDFYKTAVKRKTEVLFVKLNLAKTETNKIIAQKVRKYWKVTNETSCLAPVKDFLQEICGVELKKATFLFNLLSILESANLIEAIYALNLTNKIKNNVFELSKYTQEDIDKCITALNRKEKFSC